MRPDTLHHGGRREGAWRHRPSEQPTAPWHSLQRSRQGDAHRTNRLLRLAAV